MSRAIVKGALAALVAVAASALSAAAAPTVTDGADGAASRRVMFVSLLKMQLAGQIVDQAVKMGDGAADATRSEIVQAAEGHRSRVYATVKGELTSAFGAADRAEAGFSAFAGAVTEAENSGNGAELAALAASVGIDPVPESFAALRVQAMRNVLAAEIESAGIFLGEIQTWLRLKGQGETLPLSAWLSRDRTPGAAANAAPAPKKRRSRNSLRDAEAPALESTDVGDSGDSPLRSLRRQRTARRDKALQDAEKGFAQVSEERRLADEEANARKLAAAEAEAAAQKAHAEKLAASEQEALTQDRNSWKARLSSVVVAAAAAAGSSAAGSVGGSFGSSVGGTAAQVAVQAAVQAVFKE